MGKKAVQQQLQSFMPVIGREPDWVQATRSKHFQFYLENGLPQKQEHWRHADISLIEAFCQQATKTEAKPLTLNWTDYKLTEADRCIAFVDGFIQTAAVQDGIIACSLKDAFVNYEALVQTYWPMTLDATKHPFANLNEALFSDGLFVYVPKNLAISYPLHLLTMSQENASLAHLKHLIILEDNSQLTLFDEHRSLSPDLSFMSNNNVMIFLGKQATLDYYKINRPHQGIHLTYTQIKQQKNSSFRYHNFSCGGKFNRDDTTVFLQQHGAHCRASGFYRLREDHEYRDHHFDVVHGAPHTTSELLYKGILDKQSKAVFNGKLFIKPHTNNIKAHQANHNLLLAKNAEVYSKPDLEIYADDVQCKHAATIGQLNESAIFYLRSRGLTKSEAINLLLQGFAEELLVSLAHEDLTKTLRAMVQS